MLPSRRAESAVTVRLVIDPDTARKLTAAGRKARDARTERDRLIREAYEQGAGVREIARLVGLAHPSVIKIVRSHCHGE